MRHFVLLLILTTSLFAGSPGTLRTGAVATAHSEATRVGVETLERGGNAVDAAIAVGFALAVVHPTAGNIGGGGFMVIRFPDGRATTIDFRERAPARANPEMFLDDQHNYSADRHHHSHLSVGVPGTVAGFALAHDKYGRTPWPELMAPSVKLAAEGFTITPGLAKSLADTLERFRKHPPTLAQFTRAGTPYQSGDQLIQPDLGQTLTRIQELGRDGFYLGETADLFIREIERGGGLITAKDLRNYNAVERPPLRTTFRGYDIITMPPPSSGGVALIEMLNILDGFDLAALGHNSPSYVHHLTESMRIAYRDRARYVADPDSVEIPVTRLTSPDYAASQRATINPTAASHSAPEQLDQPYESEQTTHYSIVDADGLAVAVTTTLEEEYGVAMIVPGAGFLMNNEMGDFNAAPGLTTTAGLIGTSPNLARPGQRMLSSMTPTILAREGRLVAVLGSPGGRGIINTVLQLVLNRVVFNMPAEQAVREKRFHHQWLPPDIKLEQGLLDTAGIENLKQLGHTITERETQGRSHVIFIDSSSNIPLPIPDPREQDAAGSTTKN